MRTRTLASRGAVLVCGAAFCGIAWATMPTVKVVPWVPSDPTIPHDTYKAKTIALKGTTDVQGSGFTWTWDFGDGSPVATGTVTDKYNLEAKHAYTGADGTLYTARLTVQDTSTGESASKPYYVLLAAKSLSVEVNVAIDEGLWYLHKTMRRWDAGGIDLGDWYTGTWNWRNYASFHAENVCAFESQGHLETGSADNPYTETVRRGLHRVFQRLSTPGIPTLKTIPSGTYTEDINGNTIGVCVDDGNELYQGGMVMDCIVASGTPNAVTVTGGANILGRKYSDILQDMVEFYLYAQYTGSSPYGGGGGWRYGAGQYPDNSVCQWAAIGMIPAEREWGLTVPQWMKDWNIVWLSNSQDGGIDGTSGYGDMYGGFGYQPYYWYPWGPWATTPSGMVQMAMDGIGRGTPTVGWPGWDEAETVIRNHWDSGWNGYHIKTYYYGLFSFVKSMLLHAPGGVPSPITLLQSSTAGVVPLDWYGAEAASGDPSDGVARTLVNSQDSNGYWWGHDVGSGEQAYFETAWAILMLNRTIFDPGIPVAVPKAIPNPGVVGEVITLDGSASFHKSALHSIVSWEWDVDNDGSFDGNGPVIFATFSSLGTYPVKLRVKDDSSPQKTAEAYVNVLITTPPVAPTADANGPYVFCPQAKPWYLDGRLSTNPDEGKHQIGAYPGDTIKSYEWDLNGDNDFSDATGATPDVTSFFDALGPGTYVVQLKVTDTTSQSFPSSGMGDLSSVASATVHVLAATEPDCTCVTLSFTLAGKTVKLSWTAFPGAADYAVYRSLTQGGPYAEIGSTGALTYDDTTVVSKTTYYYVVRPRALNGNQLCQSNEIEATAVCDAPVVRCKPTTKCSNLARYYRQVFADSECFDEVALKIFIGDTMTPGFKAGPYGDENVLRISRGTKASVKPGTTPCVAGIITVVGEAIVWAEDPDGNAGTPIVSP